MTPELREQYNLGSASVGWWRFLAARFPVYVMQAWVAGAVIERGMWDTCRDEGHEFWCRMGPGTCQRRTALSCNDESADWDEPVSAGVRPETLT